jgi:hypothetical protein
VDWPLWVAANSRFFSQVIPTNLSFSVRLSNTFKILSLAQLRGKLMTQGRCYKKREFECQVYMLILDWQNVRCFI